MQIKRPLDISYNDVSISENTVRNQVKDFRFGQKNIKDALHKNWSIEVYAAKMISLMEMLHDHRFKV